MCVVDQHTPVVFVETAAYWLLEYRATELKPSTKKVDFLTKKIECTTPIPFDQTWSRAYKKVGVVHSIDQGPEKSEPEGALYVTLCGRVPVRARHLVPSIPSSDCLIVVEAAPREVVAENGPFPHTVSLLVLVILTSTLVHV